MYKSINNLPTSLNGSVSDSCDELIRGADEAQSEDDEDCAGEGEGDEATTEVAQGADEEDVSDVDATEDDCESLKIELE